MKNIQFHHPEFRARTRELIQGFIEHCEISRTLIGQIEHFVHDGERQYGLPVFTVYGPPHPDLETRFVGLIGHNTSHDTATPEILLQLIERLAIQPHIATGSVIRILPIADPLSVELGDPVHSDPVVAQLNDRIARFRQSCLDGVIEIRRNKRPSFGAIIEGSSSVRQATEQAIDALRRLQSEDVSPGDALQVRSYSASADHWTLSLEIPEQWSDGLTVHWVSQFLVVFFRAHTDVLVRTAPAAHPLWAF